MAIIPEQASQEYAQISMITIMDKETVLWCLDKNSDTICIRTPTILGVYVEALSVEDSIKAKVTDKSRNLKISSKVLDAYLRRRRTSRKFLDIIKVEETYRTPIYFYQNNNKLPLLWVEFSSVKGFSRFKLLFCAGANEVEQQEDEEEDDEADGNEDEPSFKPKKFASKNLDSDEDNEQGTEMHRSTICVTDGVVARLRVLESDIPHFWLWLYNNGLRPCSTIQIPREGSPGVIIPSEDKKISNDKEIICNNSINIAPDGFELITNPLVLSFDIEAYAEEHTRFPNGYELGDVVFYISVYLKRYRSPKDPGRKIGIYLVSSIEASGLNPKDLEEVYLVDTEKELFDKFWDIIRTEKPNIILGYNSMGFDIPFINKRMKIYQLKYPNLSRFKDHIWETRIKEFEWSSSAYKAVTGMYYDAPGILILDLYVEIRRSFQLKSYTLDAASEYFLKEHKVDLKAQEMFRIYGNYLSGNPDPVQMRIISDYGLQDAVLPARLFDYLHQWTTYTQMATIMGVQVMDLITRGQTIRTKSNLYRTCRQYKFVINYPRNKPIHKGKYKGAYVGDMVAGLHDDVIVVDFNSLYPSIISAYNLCYTTFIHPWDWRHIPIHNCTVFHVDIGGGNTREVRYIKKEIFKGLLPMVVEGFLTARKATRKEMEKTADPDRKMLLDKKQAAIKVSNNSVYGSLGSDVTSKSKKGGPTADLLPSALGLKWIAMTVTEIGQALIKDCHAFVEEEFKGKVHYADTDSGFFTLPDVPKDQLYDKGEEVAAKFNQQLVAPLKIEVEKVIRMIGLTAKRYIYRCYNKEGILKPDLNYKGVSAIRRDTCKWQANLFCNVAEYILMDKQKEEVENLIWKSMVDLLRGRIPYKHLMLGSSVAENYKSATCSMAKLKRRMEDLGRPIVGGSRIEYVITKNPVIEDGKLKYTTPYTLGTRGGVIEVKASDRILISDDVQEGETEIDYVYYIAHKAQTSIDQLFGAAYVGDTVIEPLVKGLQTKTEKTLKELEIQLEQRLS